MKKRNSIRCHCDLTMWGLPFALFWDINDIYRLGIKIGWFFRLTIRFLCFSVSVGVDREKETKQS